MKARDWLVENWGVKLTALFLAFVLWLMVHGDPGTERNIMVPLEIRIPRDMVITNEDRLNFVEVSIRGPLASGGFGQAGLRCVVDLPPSAPEGERLVPLTPENIQTRTPGLEIVTVRPTRIRLVLERQTSKEVQIEPTVGPPDTGLEVYNVRVSPPSALVRGPRSRLERLKSVATEVLSLQGEQGPIRGFVNLNIKDSLVHTSSAEPVEVEVEIGPRRSVQTISPVPVVTDDPSVTVRPPRVTLRILVPATFRRSLTPADFSATVAVRDLNPTLESERVKPVVTFTNPLDPAIRIKEIVPGQVTVHRTGKS
jgi:YbbR domain-containing protein